MSVFRSGAARFSSYHFKVRASFAPVSTRPGRIRAVPSGRGSAWLRAIRLSM